jgi:hypothetical protein
MMSGKSIDIPIRQEYRAASSLPAGPEEFLRPCTLAKISRPKWPILLRLNPIIKSSALCQALEQKYLTTGYYLLNSL